MQGSTGNHVCLSTTLYRGSVALPSVYPFTRMVRYTEIGGSIKVVYRLRWIYRKLDQVRIPDFIAFLPDRHD
jgi:hypothetical protein